MFCVRDSEDIGFPKSVQGELLTCQSGDYRSAVFQNTKSFVIRQTA